MIYLALTKNLTQDGNYIQVKKEFLEFKFPRNWITPYPYFSPIWENETYYIVYLVNPDLNSALYIVCYKNQNSAHNLLSKRNLTDEISVINFEVKRFHEWFTQGNENATLSSIENGSVEISRHTASYSIVRIEKAFERDNVFYNVTGVFVVCLMPERLLEVIFYTWEDKTWDKAYGDFQTILNSMVIKDGSE